MKEFQAKDCQVVWAKNHSLPKEDMQAIKRFISSKQNEIQEVMQFTKRLNLIACEVEVKFWFLEDVSTDCWLVVYYEKSCEAWVILVVNKADRAIGEIACEDPVTMRFIEEKDILLHEVIE